MAEVRERVRKRRESGAYGPEVEAALALPLPGGRPLFTEELADPIPALAEALGEEVRYDPTSRKSLVGPLITFARRTVIGLLRWWTAALSERQERINQLAARAIADLRDRPTPGLDARLQRLERELAHLRAQPDRSIDGVHARHVAEHVLPGELVSLLREARRALKPGSPIVFVTPNPATLTVGGSSFWLDPSHVRPIPPELFRFYLEVEGFVDVAIRTFEPSERRLNENVPAGPVRREVKLLHESLFGGRDYPVTGLRPPAPRGNSFTPRSR